MSPLIVRRDGRRVCAGLFALACAAAVAPAAHAAEDYAGCTGFIGSIPATISAPGIWCLRANKYTSQVSGAAITVAANNVTVDCNHFRLSGSGAPPTTTATIGIRTATSVQGATIRQCRIQGFRYGIQLVGDGHIVEDNVIDRSRYIGVYANGDGNIIRRNVVTDTTKIAPGEYNARAYGIYALAPDPVVAAPVVSGNSISWVQADSVSGSQERGIVTNGVAEGNVLLMGYGGWSLGIKLIARGVARDNVFFGGAPSSVSLYDVVPEISIEGSGEASSICRGNTVVGYGDPAATHITACQDGGQNMVRVAPTPSP